MRFRSNGMGDFIIRAIAGSFITFALTLSRCVLDLKTIHEKTGTSPTLHLAALVNERPIVVLRSSPAHSRYSRAPFFCQTAPARRAIRRYCWSLRLGTASRKPSTYGIVSSDWKAINRGSGLTARA